MAVKIKLMRLGKMRAPYYRIVVADARTKRDGRAIETIGKYHPTQEPSLIQVDSERAQYWLGVGAQPTEAVAAILKVTGDWQKFKGLPGAEGTLRVAEPKADKRVAFEKAALETANAPKDGATTPRKKAAAPAAQAVPEQAPAPEAPAVDAAASEVAAEVAVPEVVAEPVAGTDAAAAEVAAPEVAAEPIAGEPDAAEVAAEVAPEPVAEAEAAGAPAEGTPSESTEA